MAAKYMYDVCLSFAGEDRDYVEEVADLLRENGVRVFYDRYEEVELWGKDLYQHLDAIYRQRAKYCVIFISKHYAKKVWTRHELRSAQARALEENLDYILPARFDETEIPGIPNSVGYINLSRMKPKELTGTILQKVGISEPRSTEKNEQIISAHDTGSRHVHSIRRAKLSYATLKRPEAKEQD